MDPGGALETGTRRAYMPRAAASDWRTPEVVLERLHLLWDGPPDLDPCASAAAAHHLARLNFSGPAAGGVDGLSVPWTGRAFCNPPFDQLAVWAAKCAAEGRVSGNEVVLLLPARTDTRYWHEHVATARAVCFWKGRLTFVGAPACAPFPVALAYWGSRPWAFQAAFRDHGMVVTP